MEGTVSDGYWNGCEGTWRVHLLPRFSRIELLTEASCEDYYRVRLRKVSRATVKKERATLVRFVRWASIRGRDYFAPMDVPSLPKKAKGTKALDGRDKTHVTRTEVLAILDRLPERSRAGHPVKAFATLAAELGIRRETMDKLEVPKHYEPGAEFLRLSATYKEGNGRPLWLSPRARAALEMVAPARGPSSRAPLSQDLPDGSTPRRGRGTRPSSHTARPPASLSHRHRRTRRAGRRSIRRRP